MTTRNPTYPHKTFPQQTEKKLTGYRQYCLMEGCDETVHHEDRPTHYPFCGKHPEANKSWWILQEEKRHYKDINHELGIWS